jgi:peptidoglycan/LPS O-acetylase OafA/YrhL
VRLVALDLVRFFAALSVVLYHYTSRGGSNSFGFFSEVTKFGYLGVPLFFIISGYVIALSAKNRTAFEFAVSRFVRLYPVFWSGVAFTVLITSLYGRSNYTLTQILANLTMLNQYCGVDSIDGIYWTLHIELKFYGCVFLLLLFGIFHKVRLWLSIWLTLTAIHLLTNQPFFMGWFISPFYSCFFIAGIAYYLIHEEGKNVSNLFILFSSLIISSFRGFEQAAEFVKNSSVIDALISVIAIWFFYLGFFILVRGKIELSKRNFYLTLGGLTYPLYLIHNIAGKTIMDNYHGSLSKEVLVSITIVLMLLFSWLIYIGIEKRVATPMKSILLNMVDAIPSLIRKSSRTAISGGGPSQEGHHPAAAADVALARGQQLAVGVVDGTLGRE